MQHAVQLSYPEKHIAVIKLLKKKMSKKFRQQLSGAFEEETAMHKISFAKPGIRERIEELFGK
ncbi:enoyl-CoA hydratase/carnithine racemase [Candidatus Scalindua japonica]|uniref:Enoyl-CoA hydratase/carnithine racemase n=1 Tax=Candidatus Scalindua japonica TaxID=1284222 RepID=A0A286TTB1_9BACT|nr:enoyl-CoA hydratase/carnithine racemase [Candidatus Scalindua japonica]